MKPLSHPQADEIAKVAPAAEEFTFNRPLAITTTGNHIYFVSQVTPERCLELVREIRNVDVQLRHEHIDRDLPDDVPPTPIWLHISSWGGSLMDALAVADQIERFKTPIFSVAEGYCGSAATIISMACELRCITPSSYMLIHQFSNWMWGNYEQFKDEMNFQDMLMETLINFYVKHSKAPADKKPKLTRKQVKKMLKHDTYLNATQALELGVVDLIRV